MLTELRVHNFRTLINSTFRFKRRNLIIGKNNSGKTNLCYAINFLKLCARGSFSEAFSLIPGGQWDFCNYGIGDKDRKTTFSLTCDFDDNNSNHSYRYDLVIKVGDPRQATGQAAPCTIVSEKLVYSGDGLEDVTLLKNDGRVARLLRENGFSDELRGIEHYEETRPPSDSTMLANLYDSQTNQAAVRFRQHLEYISYFSFSPWSIRNGWHGSNSTGWGLNTNGDNLVQAIFQLKTSQEGRYRRVLDRVKRVEPRLEAINFLTGPEQNVVPLVELKGNRIASWASLSDGTLHSLALAYVMEVANTDNMNGKNTPHLIIIEEPENSVFVGELRHILDHAEDVASPAQILYTSHSPYFIELFDDDLDAVTLFQREDWHTTNSSLGDRKKEIEKALNQMSLGEQFFQESFWND